MSETDINNDMNSVLLKKYKKFKKIESPILNLNETSFKYNQQQILNKKNLPPALKKVYNQKINSSTMQINGKSKEVKNHLLNLKRNYKSNKTINKGILWNNNNKIKIPHLIIPKIKANSFNSLSSDRNQILSHTINKTKINNDLYNINRIEKIFLPNVGKQINEVLNLKNERSSLILIKKNENKDIELLLRKLGIYKNNEDRVIRKISVGMLNKSKKIKKKNQNNLKKKIRNKRSSIYGRNYSVKSLESYTNKNFLLNKINSSSPFIIKDNYYKEKENTKNKDNDNEEKINKFKKMKFKSMNNEIGKLKGEFKYINKKIKECFCKIKEKCENDINKAYPDYN